MCQLNKAEFSLLGYFGKDTLWCPKVCVLLGLLQKLITSHTVPKEVIHATFFFQRATNTAFNDFE